MKNSLFSRNYFLLALSILTVEVIIALFIHDSFVRPYIGDVLVVMLIYFLLKSFFPLPVLTAITAVLGFAFFIEVLQYLHIVNRLGWNHCRLARIVIGTSFSWADLLAYTAGALGVLVFEKKKSAIWINQFRIGRVRKNR
jgi:Protein of unknown function (DUF2809)